jgi:NAD-dependent SIR2 family protein deacetylase
MASRITALRLSPADRVIVVLGAGATKACGGPLTGEILPRAFASRHRHRLAQLEGFLVQQFGLPKTGRGNDDFPQLPLLLSLLDTAIDRDHGFGGRWTVDQLRRVRKEAEYAVFDAIAEGLRARTAPDVHRQLFEWIWRSTGRPPDVISLNYDLLADQALIAMEGGGFPDYGCQIDTAGYMEGRRWGRLFKIHGSMNWIYCGACDRLELGIDKRGETFKIALSIARRTVESSRDLQQYYQTRAARCPRCDGEFRPVMITPTHLKDYRNPHIAALWYQAERVLHECTRVIFVGYSLPWDDVDVIYLLKRGLLRKQGKPPTITVVEHALRKVPIEKHDAGRRYRAVFGRNIDWQPIGFEKWIQQVLAA